MKKNLGILYILVACICCIFAFSSCSSEEEAEIADEGTTYVGELAYKADGMPFTINYTFSFVVKEDGTYESLSKYSLFGDHEYSETGTIVFNDDGTITMQPEGKDAIEEEMTYIKDGDVITSITISMFTSTKSTDGSESRHIVELTIANS